MGDSTGEHARDALTLANLLKNKSPQVVNQDASPKAKDDDLGGAEFVCEKQKTGVAANQQRQVDSPPQHYVKLKGKDREVTLEMTDLKPNKQ
ncbi:Uncharacterized protein PBTT_09363 [Plasmodiophora brassicae]